MPSQYTNLPEFISSDADEIYNQWVQAYEAKVGRPVTKMQTEQILLEVMAYKEKALIDKYNAGGRSQLIDFSTAPMLDYLVALVKTKRLASQFASTVIEYQIITGHTGVTIPAGSRVRSSDGKATFYTNSTQFVPVGTYIIDIDCTCQTDGVIGNDYAVGSINVIVDPFAFVISASNITVSAGGADPETDDQLISRAKDAPDSFSNAGPKGAYRFFAKSAHPSIIDVAVVGPGEGIVGINPGEVYLYPLVRGGGVTPTPILDSVLATCSAEDVRPLNDAVFAVSPSSVDFDIEVDLTTYDWAIDTDVIANVGQLLNDYAQSLKSKLAIDAIVAKIESICMQSEVYNVSVVLPVADVTLQKNQYANIGTITVNVVGHHA